MNASYASKILVDSNAIDFNGKLKLPAVMKYFQNGASEHAAEMGVDYFTLKEKSNAFWVITKIRLQLHRYPRWNDVLTMTTWPLRPALLKFNREFRFADEAGTNVIDGTSEWCVLDGQTHRPRKLSSTCYPDFPHLEERAGTKPFRRFEEEVTTGDLCYEKVVRPSDLDLNYHMNNTIYTEMALDCFSVEELNSFTVKDFEIHFANECREGDIVQMYRKEIEGGYYIEGVHTGTLASVFQVMMEVVKT